MEIKKRNLTKKINTTEVTKLSKKTAVDTLLKKPIVQIAVIVASIYGVLFISKFFINECAQLITASKKLRDARKL